MLDYEKLVQHVDSVDTTECNTITFNVNLYCPELEENYNTECKITRRVSGWGIRTELWIDGLCYESGTLYIGHDAQDTTRLMDLYDALEKKQYALHDDKRTATLGWIDTMQDMMEEKYTQRVTLGR